MNRAKVAYDAETDQALAHMAAQRAAATDPTTIAQVLRGDQLAAQIADQFGADRDLVARVVTRCSVEINYLLRCARAAGMADRDAANFAANVLALAGERLAHPEPEGTQP